MLNRSVNATQEPRHPPPQDGHPVGGCLFAAASLMARKGMYAEASQLLRQAREANECSDADALDLRARICAQQGMFVQAEACWIEALRGDPGNTAYVNGIARLRQSQDPLRRVETRLAIFGIVAAAAVGLLFAIIGYHHLRQRQDDMAGKLVRLESGLNDLRTAQTDAQCATASHLEAIRKDLRQSQADAIAAIGKLPTLSHVDSQFRQIAAATQGAMDQIVGDAKQRDAHLAAQRKEDRAATEGAIRNSADALAKELASQVTKAQGENARQLKAYHDQHTLAIKTLVAQIEQNAKAITALQSETKEGLDVLGARLRQTASDIQLDLESVRREFDRLLWFRWPSSSKAEIDHDLPSSLMRGIQPTTRPGNQGATP